MNCHNKRKHRWVDTLIIGWPNERINQTQVVEEIFGDSIHREVVGRSAKLLRFLSGMEDSLTTEHLDLIWKSCVGKAEPELQVRGGRCSDIFLRIYYD